MARPLRLPAWYECCSRAFVARDTTPRQQQLWLGLSLAFAAFYGCWAISEPLSVPHMVQNDVRQHVFWLRQYLDPDLFVGDRIVDYFESVAPAGFVAFYRFFILLGIDPVALSKVLPLVLGLATTVYCFYLTVAICPMPIAGFIAAMVLNQTMWLRNDISSATPRAFVYVFFLAFLYYLLRRRLWLSLIAVALLGLFYPQYALLAGGIVTLRLVTWRGWCPQLQIARADLRFNLSILAAIGVIVGAFALRSSEFGPVISAEAARQMPEFWKGGRSAVFHDDAWHFYTAGGRSGLFPQYWLAPVTLVFGFFLPGMMAFGRSAKAPPYLVKSVKALLPGWQLLLQLVISSVGFFVLAHLLLFRLHLPSRYTNHSFRIAIAISAAVVIALIVGGLCRWTIANPTPIRQLIAAPLAAIFAIAVVLYPCFLNHFPRPVYSAGEAPGLYQFLQQQPKDSLVASLSGEADFLPTHASRSVLVSFRLQSTYHVGYHNLTSQRAKDLIRAQYMTDASVMRAVIRQYGITHWLLDRAAFDPQYLETNRWFVQWQEEAERVRPLLSGDGTPAIARALDACTVFESEAHVLLEADCLLQMPK